MTRDDKRVAFFYDEEIGNYCYGGGNPMRPHRVRLTNSLVTHYGLKDKMRVVRPRERDYNEITHFHADDYVEFLRSVTPENQEQFANQLRRFNLGPVGEADCPVFDGMYEYCALYSGGSVDGAALLCNGEDIAFNWSGGMHHAKKAEASGFCYINDIVLAIVELLKVHHRVLYVDIDIHHGDGVEEAFYTTDRVFTVSFHKYGDFFPGTGALEDVGWATGRNFCMNVPLKEGMDDDSYRMIFEPIIQKIMDRFCPGAVVVCGGADSLSGDRLGCFNLSLEGHANCMEFLSRFNVPMLILGGGGYTMRNVARCWTYETGRLLNINLPDELPEQALEEYNYYMDTGRLRIATSNMKNANTKEELDRILRFCLQALDSVEPPSGAQFAHAPPLHPPAELPEEDPDCRGGGTAYDDIRRTKAGDEEGQVHGVDTTKPVKGEMQLGDVRVKAKPRTSVPVAVQPEARVAADADAAAAAPRPKADAAGVAAGNGNGSAERAPEAPPPPPPPPPLLQQPAALGSDTGQRQTEAPAVQQVPEQLAHAPPTESPPPQSYAMEMRAALSALQAPLLVRPEDKWFQHFQRTQEHWERQAPEVQESMMQLARQAWKKMSPFRKLPFCKQADSENAALGRPSSFSQETMAAASAGLSSAVYAAAAPAGAEGSAARAAMMEAVPPTSSGAAGPPSPHQQAPTLPGQQPGAR